MSVHVRTQIRRQAKALLADLEAGHGNVFVGRTLPTGSEILPCLLIYTTDEPAFDGAASPVTQQRTLTLKVEGRRSEADDEALLDGLDEMARQVETKLLAAGAFGDLVQAIALAQTLTLTAQDTDRRLGQIEMTFAVEYLTAAGLPEAAL